MSSLKRLTRQVFVPWCVAAALLCTSYTSANSTQPWHMLIGFVQCYRLRELSCCHESSGQLLTAFHEVD